MIDPVVLEVVAWLKVIELELTMLAIVVRAGIPEPWTGIPTAKLEVPEAIPVIVMEVLDVPVKAAEVFMKTFRTKPLLLRERIPRPLPFVESTVKFKSILQGFIMLL